MPQSRIYRGLRCAACCAACCAAGCVVRCAAAGASAVQPAAGVKISARGGGSRQQGARGRHGRGRGVGGAAAGCRQGAQAGGGGRRCALLADGLRALLLRSVGRRASSPFGRCARGALASRRGSVASSPCVLASSVPPQPAPYVSAASAPRPQLRLQGLAAPVLRPLRARRSARARPPPCLQCLRARVLAAPPPCLPPSLSRAALRPTASNCAPPCIAPSYWVLIIQKKMLIIGPIAAHGRTSSAVIAYLYRRINRIAYG